MANGNDPFGMLLPFHGRTVPLEASRASLIMQNLSPWSNRWNLCPMVKPEAMGLYRNKGSHKVELSMGPTNSGKAHGRVLKCVKTRADFFFYY
jgi:hypothetical protein